MSTMEEKRDHLNMRSLQQQQQWQSNTNPRTGDTTGHPSSESTLDSRSNCRSSVSDSITSHASCQQQQQLRQTDDRQQRVQSFREGNNFASTSSSSSCHQRAFDALTYNPALENHSFEHAAELEHHEKPEINLDHDEEWDCVTVFGDASSIHQAAGSASYPSLLVKSKASTKAPASSHNIRRNSSLRTESVCETSSFITGSSLQSSSTTNSSVSSAILSAPYVGVNWQDSRRTSAAASMTVVGAGAGAESQQQQRQHPSSGWSQSQSFESEQHPHPRNNSTSCSRTCISNLIAAPAATSSSTSSSYSFSSKVANRTATTTTANTVLATAGNSRASSFSSNSIPGSSIIANSSQHQPADHTSSIPSSSSTSESASATSVLRHATSWKRNRRGAIMVSCEELFPESISGSSSIQGLAACDPASGQNASQQQQQQQNPKQQQQPAYHPSFSSMPSSSSHHNNSLRSNLKRSPLSRSRSGGIFSNPFRSDRDKMEQLVDLLNQYSLHGIPETNSLLSARNKETSSFEERLGSIEIEDSGTASSSIHFRYRDPMYLEENWRLIVYKPHLLDKRMQGQQDAIWELISTEVFYIKRLRVVTDLFLSCLTSLQSECLLNDIDADKMFSNINQVYEVNRDFWINHLMPMLNHSRSTGDKLDPSFMLDGFLRFEHIFQPYIKYCLEHSNCLQYVKEKHKENELFKAYVVWCETRKDCERLRLMDLLVKPMQRLTKYSLILKAILRKTDVDAEIQAVKRMNECVEQFVLSVDASLRQRHEEERLAWIASRIESYDAIDVNSDEIEKLVKEYCKLDFLLKPMIDCRRNQMRQLILEGSNIRLKDSLSSGKIDIHLFLFTDLLLICKKSISKKTNDKVKVIRPPLLVDRIIPVIVEHHHHGPTLVLIHVNEFNVAVSVYLLHTSDAKIWLESIRKAQKRYSDAKQRAYLMQISNYTLNPGIYRSTVDDDDSSADQQPMVLLSSHFHSPRSSRSSLLHSYSGSMEMSESASNFPSYMGSSQTLMIPPPAPTPNLLMTDTLLAGNGNTVHPSRARSFELGDLRNPSLSAQVDMDNFARSHSMETRSSISVLVTSPRPERRAFLLRGSGSPSGSMGPTDTLVVPNRSNVVPVVEVQQQEEEEKEQQGSQSEANSSPCKEQVGKGQPQERQAIERNVILTMNAPAASSSSGSSIASAPGFSDTKSQPSPGTSVQQQPPATTLRRDLQTGTRSASAAPILSAARKSSSASSSSSHSSTQTHQAIHHTSSASSTISVKPPPPKVPPRRPPAVAAAAGSVSVICGTSSVASSSSPPLLQRCSSPVNKPPLVKTKNYSATTASCFPAASDCKDTDATNTGTTCVEKGKEAEAVTSPTRIYHQKRTSRSERRYFTADAIDGMKTDASENSSDVQKRLSLNYGKQAGNAMTTSIGLGKHPHHLLSMEANSEVPPLSSDSVHSSSGFSSCLSVMSASDSECCCSSEGTSTEQLTTVSAPTPVPPYDVLEKEEDMKQDAKTRGRSDFGTEALSSLRQESRSRSPTASTPTPTTTTTTTKMSGPAPTRTVFTIQSYGTRDHRVPPAIPERKGALLMMQRKESVEPVKTLDQQTLSSETNDQQQQQNDAGSEEAVPGHPLSCLSTSCPSSAARAMEATAASAASSDDDERSGSPFTRWYRKPSKEDLIRMKEFLLMNRLKPSQV